jgi:hypothetical protein
MSGPLQLASFLPHTLLLQTKTVQSHNLADHNTTSQVSQSPRSSMPSQHRSSVVSLPVHGAYPVLSSVQCPQSFQENTYVLPRREYLFSQRSLHQRLNMSYDSNNCWLHSVETIFFSFMSGIFGKHLVPFSNSFVSLHQQTYSWTKIVIHPTLHLTLHQICQTPLPIH